MEFGQGVRFCRLLGPITREDRGRIDKVEQPGMPGTGYPGQEVSEPHLHGASHPHESCELLGHSQVQGLSGKPGRLCGQLLHSAM